MRLDYGTVISPYSIPLSVCTIRKPFLRDIADGHVCGFGQFGLYETLLCLTPRAYFEVFGGDEGKEKWKSMTDDERKEITIYGLIENDGVLRTMYLSMLNFFIEEPVEFQSGFFVVLKKDTDMHAEHTSDDVYGIVNSELFYELLDLIRQVCGIHGMKNEFADLGAKKFKNEKARKMAEKMQKAAIEQEEVKKANPSMSLPNIISKICMKHNSINYTNVWDLTLFEVMDTFESLQNNEIYEISKTGVSVWGDEKKRFDASAWYKNQFDSEK